VSRLLVSVSWQAAPTHPLALPLALGCRYCSRSSYFVADPFHWAGSLFLLLLFCCDVVSICVLELHAYYIPPWALALSELQSCWLLSLGLGLGEAVLHAAACRLRILRSYLLSVYLLPFLPFLLSLPHCEAASELPSSRLAPRRLR
jgi:hypothetical protein